MPGRRPRGTGTDRSGRKFCRRAATVGLDDSSTSAGDPLCPPYVDPCRSVRRKEFLGWADRSRESIDEESPLRPPNHSKPALPLPADPGRRRSAIECLRRVDLRRSPHSLQWGETGHSQMNQLSKLRCASWRPPVSGRAAINRRQSRADRRFPMMVEALPQAVIAKADEPTIGRPTLRKALGRRPPPAAAAQHIENRIRRFRASANGDGGRSWREAAEKAREPAIPRRPDRRPGRWSRSRRARVSRVDPRRPLGTAEARTDRGALGRWRERGGETSRGDEGAGRLGLDFVERRPLRRASRRRPFAARKRWPRSRSRTGAVSSRIALSSRKAKIWRISRSAAS